MAKITNTSSNHIAIRTSDGKDVGLAPGETGDMSPDKANVTYSALVRAGVLVIGAEAAARVGDGKVGDAAK